MRASPNDLGAQSYSLLAEYLPGNPTPGEPNNTRVTATTIDPVTTLRAYLDLDDTQDRYQIYMDAGQVLTVSVRVTGWTTLTTSLHAPNWDPRAENYGSTSILRITAQTDGMHRIVVEKGNWSPEGGGLPYLMEARVTTP